MGKIFWVHKFKRYSIHEIYTDISRNSSSKKIDKRTQKQTSHVLSKTMCKKFEIFGDQSDNELLLFSNK